MKKLLLLSYYFPPLGMGGAQRPAKFAKYLPEFGWQPTVLTVKPVAYWAEDASLLDELAKVRIIRTESWDPQRLLVKWGKANPSVQVAAGAGSKPHRFFRFLNEKLLPFFLIPDSKILWRGHAVRAALKLMQREKFDALYTTSPPHSAHLIGQRIAKKCGLRWVADFRDSWAGGVVVHEPTRLQRLMNQHLQNSVLEQADAVISVSSGIQNELLKSPAGHHEKFCVIPNGFDADDFPIRSRPADDGRFVICHCGSVTAFSDPQPLLDALPIFRKRHPELADKVLFQFVGYESTASLQERFDALGLGSMLHVTGYQPHREALQYLVNADALLLIARGKAGATFIPSKTFEYLGAKKPILALTDVQDTIEFLSKIRQAVVLGLRDHLKIAGAIASFVRGEGKSTNEAFIAQFDRKLQAERLASILDRLT